MVAVYVTHAKTPRRAIATAYLARFHVTSGLSKKPTHNEKGRNP